LMDGVEIGPNVQLTDCILGRRCKIEGGGAKDADKTVLKDCEVQDGQVVEWGSEYSLCNCGAPHQLTTVQLNRRTRNSCASTLETVSTTTMKTGSATMALALWMPAKTLICRSRSQLRWLGGWNGNIDMNDTRNLLLANFLKRR
jgi:hypothetical protein